MKKLIEKIHQGILNIHNAATAAIIFYKEFLKILRIEQNNGDKYNHEDYDSCYDRMSAMVNDAVEPVKKIEALSACNHRSDKHADDTAEEAEELMSTMSVNEVATVRAWWKK